MPRLDRLYIREHRMSVSFNLRELADLQAIAKAWGVPVAQAVWAIVADRLFYYRRQRSRLGARVGIGVAAAATLLPRLVDAPARAQLDALAEALSEHGEYQHGAD